MGSVAVLGDKPPFPAEGTRPTEWAASMSGYMQPVNFEQHCSKCHQIKGAALALLGDGNSDGLAASAINEFSSLARRHGLSLIFDNGRSGKDQSNFIEHSLDGQKLPASKPVMPIPDEQIRHPYSCWGINE